MGVGIVILPERPWSLDRERWQRVEAYGFDHAWIYDHLAWRSLADGPWHAIVPTLTAAALVTERIRIGTLVATPNYRHPVPFAKELMTLDVMSQGRLTVGLGAGGPGFDAAVLGDPTLTPAARHDRFVEFRALLDELLCAPLTTWAGTWYRAVDARMIPGPTQQPRPPFLVAAEGPRGMRLAVSTARPGDGWVTVGIPGGAPVSDDEWWGQVASSAARLDTVLSESGTGAPDGFVRLLNMESRTSTIDSLERLRDQFGRAGELGFTDVVLAWPRPSEPFCADESLLDLVAGALPELRALLA